MTSPTSKIEFTPLIKKSNTLLRKHFLKIFCPFAVISILMNIGDILLPAEKSGLALQICLGLSILLMPLYTGTSYMVLKLVRGENANLKDGMIALVKAPKIIAASLIFCLLIGLGFAFLIIPGIILLIGLFPYYLLLLDEDESIFRTLQKAWRITREHRWEIMSNYIVLECIIVFLSFIITIPAILVYSSGQGVSIMGATEWILNPFAGPPIVSLVGMLSYTYIAVFSVLLYQHLYEHHSEEGSINETAVAGLPANA